MYTYSAPGSVMMLGEHAVLHGYPSVVLSVDRFIHVTLTPRTDRIVVIHSDRFGKHEATIDTLVFTKPFQFVLAACLQYRDLLLSGFDLKINSEFSDKVGLGSSAAVVVATLGAIQKWLFKKSDQEELFQKSLAVIQQIQGVGSGADVAASVYRGVIKYQINPLIIEKIDAMPPVHLIYVGYKTPTVEVIHLVNQFQKENPSLVERCFKDMGVLVDQSVDALKKHDWKLLGQVFKKHQVVQKKLGVSDDVIDEIIAECEKISSVFGAKISGSGLGDCVIVLGALPPDYFPMNDCQKEKGIVQIDLNVSVKI